MGWKENDGKIKKNKERYGRGDLQSDPPSRLFLLV
jgi:hypothetical protein